MSITIGKIIDKLQSIGYVEKRIASSHIIMYHEKSNSTIVLPAFQKNKVAALYLINTIKKNVVEKGIISSTEFDILIK